MTSEDPTFKSLQDAYFLIERNFDALLAACTTDAQRAQLRADYGTLRQAFWDARDNVLRKNDPNIETLCQCLTDETAKVEASLKQVQNTVETLRAVTQAVAIASKLRAAAVPG